MEKILRFVEKLIPKKLFRFFQPTYHYTLSLLSAIIYGFPSKKIKIVGVTGTKGKSSVVEIINAIFEEAGYKTALAGTIRFKIGEKTKRNLYKMTMPGRFFIQKFLNDAVKNGCHYAFLEMTSEGARLFRHKWIDLDALVFTNLSPEHIESHGSFEKYKKAKLELVKALEQSGKKNKKIISNTDDSHGKEFLGRLAEEKIPYSIKDLESYSINETGISFIYKGIKFNSKLRGLFNLYNILASIKTSEAFGIQTDAIVSAIEKFDEISGRVQKIEEGQNFEVIVDYAHTPDSLEKLYQAFESKNKICVLGNTGGGRDKWKRPKMAEIADNYCSHIILTNEDPYNEDPMKILEDMEAGIKKNKYEIILDRREAISKAVRMSENGDVVLITGKGTDPYIMGKNGSKVVWSDENVAREELKKILT